MNTLVCRVALAATALTTLVVLSIAAHTSPEFKQHATIAGIVLLALIGISGLLAGLILRHLDTRADTTRTTAGPQRPPDALAGTVGTAHTGDIR